MEFRHHHCHLANDKSYSSLIKKEVRVFAQEIGFDKSRLGVIEIIVSEIISNLFKHATSGQRIYFKEVIRHGISGIELIGIDSGPGMKDPVKMQEDGISTTGTLGHGLGAINRLSHEFDLYSLPGWGTIILSRYYTEVPKNYIPAKKNNVDIHAVLVSKSGEKACGDAWAYKTWGDSCFIFAVDGLGHGPDAEKAALMATANFMIQGQGSICDMLVSTHEAIRKSRGAVGAILEININKKKASYCGIGNINTKIFSPSGMKTFLSYNGIIGLNKPNTLHEQEKALEENQLFIISSDGLKTRWDLSKYPMIGRYDGSILAAALYKDQSRYTDDTMVIVVRVKK